MLYFKNPTTNNVAAFETQQERIVFGDPSLIEMTEAEVTAHLTPPPPPVPTPAEQIEALERQYMLPRPVRDVLLPLMEAKAAELGYTTAQLRASNPGYRKVKELDEQIAALRALL